MSIVTVYFATLMENHKVEEKELKGILKFETTFNTIRCAEYQVKQPILVKMNLPTWNVLYLTKQFLTSTSPSVCLLTV